MTSGKVRPSPKKTVEVTRDDALSEIFRGLELADNDKVAKMLGVLSGHYNFLIVHRYRGRPDEYKGHI